MSNRFMMSVAVAALIAGTGFANAQGTGTSREAPSAGAATTQSAPPSDRAAPSSATPMNRNDASQSGAPAEAPKSAQSDEKMQPPGGKAGPKGEKSAQDNNMKGEKSKSMSSETNEKAGAAKDMKAEGRNGNMNADSKGAADAKSQTTGQAAAGGKLSTEQRTKITTVIKQQKVDRVDASKLNISISIGARIPERAIHFHPLPQEVFVIYPEWRGYDYILVGDQILVIDPRSHEIVAILEA